jgi:hypothetical protein
MKKVEKYESLITGEHWNLGIFFITILVICLVLIYLHLYPMVTSSLPFFLFLLLSHIGSDMYSMQSSPLGLRSKSLGCGQVGRSQ